MINIAKTKTPIHTETALAIETLHENLYCNKCNIAAIAVSIT